MKEKIIDVLSIRNWTELHDLCRDKIVGMTNDRLTYGKQDHTTIARIVDAYLARKIVQIREITNEFGEVMILVDLPHQRWQDPQVLTRFHLDHPDFVQFCAP